MYRQICTRVYCVRVTEGRRDDLLRSERAPFPLAAAGAAAGAAAAALVPSGALSVLGAPAASASCPSLAGADAASSGLELKVFISIVHHS